MPGRAGAAGGGAGARWGISFRPRPVNRACPHKPGAQATSQQRALASPGLIQAHRNPGPTPDASSPQTARRQRARARARVAACYTASCWTGAGRSWPRSPAAAWRAPARSQLRGLSERGWVEAPVHGKAAGWEPCQRCRPPPAPSNSRAAPTEPKRGLTRSGDEDVVAPAPIRRGRLARQVVAVRQQARGAGGGQEGMAVRQSGGQAGVPHNTSATAACLSKALT